MPYVDGFVVPVPKKKLEAYRRLARKTGKVWREYGALDFKECVADDVKMGKWTSFPRSVNASVDCAISPLDSTFRSAQRSASPLMFKLKCRSRD